MSKEAVVIILDVGRSMGSTSALGGKEEGEAPPPLEAAIKAVTLLLQQKLLFGKSDEVGIVLFGTEETNNRLSEDGYQHISVLHEIGPPNLELLHKLDGVSPEKAEGDFIDALIVGMDLLLHKTAGKRFQQRIFLVTDAGSPVNGEDFDTIVEQFQRMDARLNIIGINFAEEEDLRAEEEEEEEESKDEQLRRKRENELLLRQFAEKVEGVVVPVSQALEMMSYFRSHSVLQRTVFRGDLEISSRVRIPVWSYCKTMERKFPTLKKVSAVSQMSANPQEMEVRLERTYHSLADPDVEISPDERVKGYKYGKTLVPFSEVDESVLKYEADKCLKLVGFTSANKVPRQHFMGNVECMVAEPGDNDAAVALSSLVHALAETNSAAIVRYVKRAKALPYLGCLLPHIKPDFECLFFATLPFAEDIRQYPFASLAVSDDIKEENATDIFGRSRKSLVPTSQQLKAAEDLICSLDLITAAKDEEGEPMEALKPKYTYNPTLQHLYQCVQFRAFYPDRPLPKLDPILESYIKPDEELLRGAKRSFEEFSNQFTFAKSEAPQKEQRRFWKERLESENVQLDSYVPTDFVKKDKPKYSQSSESAILSMETLMSAGCMDVGSVKPAKDFKDMIARRDIDLVDKAIGQMKERIVQLVDDSLGSQLFPKALECLQALREGCILEEEGQQFNDFLFHLQEKYKGQPFWRAIVASGISLIMNTETEDSAVTFDEAKEFIQGTGSATHSQLATEIEEKKASVDDLFSMIE